MLICYYEAVEKNYDVELNYFLNYEQLYLKEIKVMQECLGTSLFYIIY